MERAGREGGREGREGFLGVEYTPIDNIPEAMLGWAQQSLKDPRCAVGCLSSHVQTHIPCVRASLSWILLLYIICYTCVYFSVMICFSIFRIVVIKAPEEVIIRKT